jgi:hypothetical protein
VIHIVASHIQKKTRATAVVLDKEHEVFDEGRYRLAVRFLISCVARATPQLGGPPPHSRFVFPC